MGKNKESRLFQVGLPLDCDKHTRRFNFNVELNNGKFRRI